MNRIAQEARGGNRDRLGPGPGHGDGHGQGHGRGFSCQPVGLGANLRHNTALSEMSERSEGSAAMYTLTDPGGNTYRIEEHTTVGREGCDLEFPSEQGLSRRHAEFRLAGEGMRPAAAQG